jgi:hypothetical protein
MRRPRQRLAVTVFTLCTAFAAAAARADEESKSPEAVGDRKSGKLKALDLGAKVLQSTAPVDQIAHYLVGYHPMKSDPSHQMEAHHYCHQVNQDFAQCVLYDGNTAAANLIGVEYIISEKTFETLDADERQLWHPHNYEILSGQLIAPGLPAVAEKQAMREKMNSYGKTWHTWDSKRTGKPEADRLPLGEPMLMWSFNADGEAKPGTLEERDRRFGVDTTEIRESRQELVQLANPQEGVDALKERFTSTKRVQPKGVEAKPTDTAH